MKLNIIKDIAMTQWKITISDGVSIYQKYISGIHFFGFLLPFQNCGSFLPFLKSDEYEIKQNSFKLMKKITDVVL
jgi:hypothetical protein